MVGAQIEFDFSEEWNGLVKTAVFRCSGTKDVLLSESGVTVVPHEILAVPGMDVEVGIHGVREDGTTWPSPTSYCKIGVVDAGADPSGD
jgi:L-aminopeptidase/D-esterase-like protein